MSECLQCPKPKKRKAKTRGLCGKCYLRSNRAVRRGKTTWAKLEAAELAIPENIVFPAQVKKPAGRWLDHQVFESAKHGICRTEIGSSARSGLPRTSLRRYASKPCRYNEDEPIFTLLVAPPIVHDDPEIRVFPDSVIDQVAARYNQEHEQQPKPVPEDDDAYLTTAQVEEKAGVGKYFVEHWRYQPSKLRRGEKALRAHKESVGAGRVRSMQWVHRLGDVRAILRGEESIHPAIGRPGHRRPGTKSNHEAEIKVQEYLLSNGPVSKSDFFGFCRAERISQKQRRHVLKKLKIKPMQIGAGSTKESYYGLPGQERPSKLAHAPKLRAAVEFLQDALVKNDCRMPVQQLIKRGSQRNLSERLLYDAKPHAGVVSEWEVQNSHRRAFWKLVRKSATNGHASPAQSLGSRLPRKGPGRPQKHAEVLNFVRSRPAGVSLKTSLANYRTGHPNHPIFSTSNPYSALRALISRRSKASV
jgi:hypothetical protein